MTRPQPDRERENDPSIRRWLHIADEFMRRKSGKNGKKGGERSAPGERPESERRETSSR
jgi:hypothetical protein